MGVDRLPGEPWNGKKQTNSGWKHNEELNNSDIETSGGGCEVNLSKITESIKE